MNYSLRTLIAVSLAMLSLTACKRSTSSNQSATGATPTTAQQAAQPSPTVSEAEYQAVKQKIGEELKNEPDNLHYDLGNVAAAAGKYEEAVSEYQQSLKVNPKDADCQTRLGQAFLKLNNTNGALAAFQAATKLDPKQTEAWVGLGDMYRRLNRYADAIAAYKAALAAKPGQSAVYFSLGNTYDRIGQTGAATDAYREAARLDPKDADAFFNLGNSLSRLNKFDEAIEAYRQAVAIKPDDADAHLRLGVLYLEKKDKGAATDEINKLKTLNAQYAQMLAEKIAQQ